ncbi:MAG: tripartite tricarboxylate transporter substrate binding protein [Proteobacteria bacterium]|nr:tripartite tricarboxylate transporter substrate binding protein [Burkholderiales bacterium]
MSEMARARRATRERRCAYVCTAALALVAAAAPASAQSWPAKPIRMIVPFPPGGPTDIFGRLMADALSRQLGTAVVTDNRAGAGGNIGVAIAAKAPADGYTISMFTVAQSIAPSVFPKLEFDPAKDFAPITLIARLPSILLVHPSLPVKNVKDLVALMQKRPGALNYASTGPGTSPHMLMEMFLLMTGTKAVHIPYKGAGPALVDQMAGMVELAFTTGVGPSLEAARSGKLRVLAVSTAERYAALPDLPSVDEAGVKGFDGSSWQALVAPAGVPKEIIGRLNAEAVKWIRSPEGTERIAQQGGNPGGNSPEEFARFIQDEIARWGKVARAAKVRID